MVNLKIRERNNSKLDEMFLTVTIIRNEVNINKVGIVEKCDLYTMVGICINGRRNVFSVSFAKSTSRGWLDKFESLKSRGLKKILFISLPDDPVIKKAIKIAYPTTILVDSLTEISPNFYKYTSERSDKTIHYRLKQLYIAEDFESFKVLFEIFKTDYCNAIQKILIDKYLKNIKSYYKYSAHVRKLLFSNRQNLELCDRIRVDFMSEVVTSIDDVYEFIDGNIKINHLSSSFSKNELVNITCDLINLFPDVKFL